MNIKYVLTGLAFGGFISGLRIIVIDIINDAGFSSITLDIVVTAACLLAAIAAWRSGGDDGGLRSKVRQRSA